MSYIRNLSLLVLLTYLGICFLTLFGWIGSDFNLVNNDIAYLPPSSEFWFGTDIFGRSVFARALHGTKVSLSIGFFASIIALLIGLFFGSLAGYFGGKIDDFIVWIYTTLESIPYILLLAAFAYSLGQGLVNIYLALGLTGWVQTCRLIRAEFMKHKEQEYIQAATAMGATHGRKIIRHILPNVFHVALIQFNLGFIQAIRLEVILSYLGLGVEVGTPSWGTMIYDATTELQKGVWWNLAAATAFMFFLILSVSLLTQELQRRGDPKTTA